MGRRAENGDRCSPVLRIALLVVLAASPANAVEPPVQEDRELSQLIEALESRDAAVRQDAIGRLERMGPAARLAAPTLAKCLSDPDSGVRVGAAYALARVGPDPSAAPGLARLVRTEGSGSEVAAEALVMVGAQAVPAVVPLLTLERDASNQAKNGVWQRAAEILGRIGPPALPALVKALRDPNRRAAAAIAIGDIGPDAARAVPTLVSVADPNDFASLFVYEALGKIGPRAAAGVPALAAGTKAADPGIRNDAAQALGKIGPRAVAAVGALDEMLRGERETHERREQVSVSGELVALHALAAIGPGASSALPEIRKALQHRNSTVREAAQAAIAKIEGATASSPSPTTTPVETSQ